MNRLENKIVIVTGATRGIGRATAKLFAAEGAKVVFSGRKEDLGKTLVEEIGSAGGEAVFVPADNTISEAREKIVKTAMDQYGRIDILVNNAGIGGTVDNMDQIKDEEWTSVIATNLTSHFMMSKLVIPLMEKQGGGVIVNVASVASIGAGRGGLAYTSAKHGLLGLTRQMSLDHGHTGVRVNCVLPGPISTDMTARVRAIPQHPVNIKVKMSPAARPGEPEDVAKAILFLASDDAEYIHGAALAVDGGYSMF